MNAGFNSGIFFVLINTVAGVAHYIYQVIASRQLSAEDFADLNSWIAHFSLLMVVPATCQYAANFRPIANSRRKPVLLAFSFLIFVLFAGWLWLPGGLTLSHAVLVLIAASLLGWMLGELQSRLWLLSLAVANLTVGLVKLGFVFSQGGTNKVSSFATAIFISYVPVVVFASVVLWRADRKSLPTASGGWVAPFLLSVASSIIPQMDIVLVKWTQPTDVFENFARASLFYKGIYFLVFMAAQWLLPRQIRQTAPIPGIRAFIPALVIFCAASAAITWISPWLVIWFLGWSSSPPATMVFASCLNICLLAWLYMHLQAACAEGRLKIASMVLLLLAIEAGVQWLAGLSITGYFICAWLFQGFALALVMRSTRQM